MLCDKCQKKIANIHITRVINGQKKELMLCEKCARNSEELGIGLGVTNNKFGFFNLLSGLLTSDSKPPNAAFHYVDSASCQKCNYTYEQFQRTGKLSCGSCYGSFQYQLEGLLKRIHGANRHTGKVPTRTGGSLKLIKEIDLYKRKLREVVEKEEFEEAASLRDRIRQLERKLDQEG
ncbi:MAG: UvrB/UvrC motif-containing protein [Thermincolia bacterium]